MFFKPISVTRQISRGSKDYDNSHTITFELATTRENILEISTDCVLCAPSRFRVHYQKDGMRRVLNPTLTLYRDTKFDDILPRKMVDDPAMKDAIGFATFSRHKDDHLYCAFSIPLNAESFDTLAQDIVSGVTPTEVFVEFSSPIDYLNDDPKKLEFGWEPDGSRRIWNVPEGDQTDFLPIESIRFTTTHVDARNLEEMEAHPDDALPVKAPALSLAELAIEAKKANEGILRLSKTVKNLVWLVVAAGVIILLKFAS